MENLFCNIGQAICRGRSISSIVPILVDALRSNILNYLLRCLNAFPVCFLISAAALFRWLSFIAVSHSLS